MELAKRYGMLYVLILTLVHCADVADPLALTPDCAQWRCDVEAVTYAPEPKLLDVTEKALARFAAATGRADLRIDPAGVPVVFQENLVTDPPEYRAGKVVESCAQTIIARVGQARPYTQQILVDPTPPDGCPNAWLSVMHEMVHSLAPGVEHAKTGLFAPIIDGRDIDEPALVQLCSMFACQQFVPEQH